MKWTLLLPVFGAGFVAAVILGLGPGPACRTGDLTHALNAQKSKQFEEAFGAWVHQTRQCHVGDYQVIAPLRAGAADLLVLRNGKAVFSTSERVTRFSDDERVMYEWQRGRVITYAAYDAGRHAWIENYDVNADGTIDTRTIALAGQPARREIPAVGYRWLEVAK